MEASQGAWTQSPLFTLQTGLCLPICGLTSIPPAPSEPPSPELLLCPLPSCLWSPHPSLALQSFNHLCHSLPPSPAGRQLLCGCLHTHVCAAHLHPCVPPKAVDPPGMSGPASPQCTRLSHPLLRKRGPEPGPPRTDSSQNTFCPRQGERRKNKYSRSQIALTPLGQRSRPFIRATEEENALRSPPSPGQIKSHLSLSNLASLGSSSSSLSSILPEVIVDR